MTQGTGRLLGLFVEPAGDAGSARRHRDDDVAPSRAANDRPALSTARSIRARRRTAPRGWVAWSDRSRPPAVAVLASPARVVAATAAVATGLMRVHRTRCAVAGVLGPTAPSAGSVLAPPASRRTAAQLRRGGRDAVAFGRIAWLAGNGAHAPAEEPRAAPHARDRGGDAVREVRRIGLPAVLGIALPRSPELDRVLALHDAIVVVREAGADEQLAELALASLAELDRPVVAMPPLGRLAAALATTGQWVPAVGLRVARELSGAAR